jgi:hypothetical protein
MGHSTRGAGALYRGQDSVGNTSLNGRHATVEDDGEPAMYRLFGASKRGR